ncbi:Uncharacterised protein [Candidatus Anstonella stagnisolia]|nr:Uncharacterised protein [Candidatus Anstonella stagnisolia]
MFIFQLYAQKPQEQENFQPAQFLQSDMKETERLFEKKGYSNFLQTLTPGARNAIYAASFAWGFENASRALSGAMEQKEVQDAQSKTEKSTAVVKGMCENAQDGGQVQQQAVNFVWSYYNEDLKHAQATAAKSEIMVEHIGTRQKGGVQQPGDLQSQSHPVPQIIQTETQKQAEQVLSQCIMQNDLSRSFEICAAERVQNAQQEKQKAQRMEIVQNPIIGQKIEISEEKRTAVLAEYDKAIAATEQKIGQLKDSDSKDLQKLEELVQKEPKLPEGILKRLSSLKKEDKGKRTYLAMLKKELLGLQRGRSTLSTLTGGALSKMLSLKSLLGK